MPRRTTAKERLDAPPAEGRARVIIEAITPNVDHGRFAAKRIVGDRVEVEADCFADGHDALACVLRARREDARAWQETPMQPLGNDRWQGAFVAEQIGRYRYTVAAWVDAFLSWRHDFERRVDVEDLRVAAQVGAGIIAAAAERARGTDRRQLAGWARRLAAAEDIDALRAAGLDATLASVVQRYPDRRFQTIYPVEFPVDVDRERRLIDLPPPLDPARVLVGSEQPRNALENRQQVAGPGQGRRQAEHVGEAPHEAAKLLGALDDDPDGVREVTTAGRLELAGVIERRVQQRVRGRDGIVHFVRHDANELLVGRPLELPQLLGELLHQEKTPDESTIEERAVLALHAPRAAQPHDAGVAGLERVERSRERRVQRIQPPADDVGSRCLEEPFGGRVHGGNALIEVEDDDAGWRDVQDLTQKMVLLGEPHPLVAQMVDHAVVHANQLIDLRLSDFDEAGRKLLVPDEAQAFGGESQVPEGLARESDPHGERDREHELDGQQPERVLQKEKNGKPGEDRVKDYEIRDGSGAQAHTVISYFSNRRYKAARLRPSDSATLLMFPAW